jgi:DNA-binding MarR family transcriptional regulator
MPDPDHQSDQRDELDRHDLVGHLLRRAFQHFSAAWSAQMDASLTQPQFTVLSLLDDHSPLDQQTLGFRAGLDKSTCGYLVDRLDQRGLLTASIDPANRRRKLIAITAQGRELLYAATPDAQRVDEHALAVLTPAERTRLAELLRRLTNANPV